MPPGRSPFEESRTAEGPFYPPAGAPITVPMMRQTESFAYSEGEGYQAVELPYDGRELSMLICCPRRAGSSAFEDSLTAGRAERNPGGSGAPARRPDHAQI